MADINKAVSFMITTAKDNNHGYDQQHRNGPDYDCSSLEGQHYTMQVLLFHHIHGLAT